MAHGPITRPPRTLSHTRTEERQRAFQGNPCSPRMKAIPMFTTHRSASVRVLAARLFAWLLREHFRKLQILDLTEYFVADKSFCL